jgi:hypothetical protein
MQRTTDFHDHVANAVFPQPDGLFEHTATFDAAIDMFDANPSPSELPIACFLGSRERFPTRLLRRLEDVHPRHRERLNTQVLPQLTSRRQGIRRRIGHTLVMDTTRLGLTPEEDAPGLMDQEAVLQQVALVLAALARFLWSRVVGARAGSRGAIMTTRGAAGGVVAWAASPGEASNAWGGSSTSRRARKVSTWRPGASPQVCSVSRKTGSKT